MRSALGATSRMITRLFMRRGVLLACTGVVLGMIGAVALRRVVANELYGVSALDPRVFALVPAALLVVAALACFVPARRAARINPADLFRIE